jgi:hypothetical protein
MQFLAASALLALLPSVAFASPMVTPRASAWYFLNVSHACDAADTSCTWSFAIDTTDGSGKAVVPCSFTVKGSPASQTDLKAPGATCGPYTVTAGWSGQFGPGNGFTVLAVIDYANNLRSYPSWPDSALTNGKVVATSNFPVYNN